MVRQHVAAARCRSRASFHRVRQFVAATLILAACSPFVPHDRLVLVEPSETIAAYEVSLDTGGTSRLFDLIQAGIRIWDPAGPKFRTVNQLDGETPAATLRVVADSSSPGWSGDSDLWYSREDGDVHVLLPPRFGADAGTWRGLFAHEVGHAMGLGHVGGCNVMSIGACGDTLGEADIEAVQHL
jgi:hypothetical protein